MRPVIVTTAPEKPMDRKAAIAAWGMVAVFLLLYIVSYIDRTIINMMVGPLERDLQLSDFQISLLAGPAFSIFYVLCGLPMGWLIDRYSRRWMTAIGVFVWGLATVSCGVAGSYIHIFLGRMGVGLGESTLTPAAHALISEAFPPKRLATALSVYSLGAIIGGGIATIVGGTVVHLVADLTVVNLPLIGAVKPWQAIFLIVGLPTVLLSPLVFLVKEKPAAERHARHAGAAGSSVNFWAMLKKDWVFWIGLPLGFGCTNILANAYAVWSPTLMVREFGWDIGSVGLAWGVQHMIAGSIGQLGGAMIVDWLYARGVKDAHVKYQMAGLFISVPTLVWAVNSHNPWAYLVLTGFFFCVTMPFLGYANAAMQLFAPPNLRGRISAMFLAIVTLVGTGLGATVTGYLTDHLFHDKLKVGMSLAIVTLCTAPVIFGVLWVVARKMRAMHVERDALLAAETPIADAII